jgi:hypothetical protein
MFGNDVQVADHSAPIIVLSRLRDYRQFSSILRYDRQGSLGNDSLNLADCWLMQIARIGSASQTQSRVKNFLSGYDRASSGLEN